MSAGTSLPPPKKNARFAAGIFGVTGGEGGIRLHPAGRDLACKPSPSNPTREVRRDFTPLQNETAPGGAFDILAERVGFEPTVDSRLRLISSQVHSTTLPPLRVENGYFRKIELYQNSLARRATCSGFEYFDTTHVRPQRFGNGNTAIRLLAVLQNGDQRSSDS